MTTAVHAVPVGEAVRAIPLPGVEARSPAAVAERFRDLPGLALLESARGGRRGRWSYLVADPVAVLELARGTGPALPDAAAFLAGARATLRRLAPAPAPGLPPFTGGLVGFLGYELGGLLERLPPTGRDPLDVPLGRLALHDWVLAWDARDGVAWLAGRAVDGDRAALERRLAAVRERLGEVAEPDASAAGRAVDDPTLVFTSSLDRGAYERSVGSLQEAIAAGEIYQANMTRRLDAPFAGDPWPLYRRLRTGDPSLFAAYLDLGERRAILSASPEPFIAADHAGRIATDPIKGTRPRGRTPEADRALAAELLASAKDRAENVMIVDVLRNDLGRVCVPGSVRVPRLCRVERTATVQHLVSTVTGRLAPGRDAIDLLAATLPGGSITGAPKIRAMELLADLEPTERGPYTGALCWLGPDGAIGSSILIRTLVADGARLSIGVGGGITRRSDPAREWDETLVKLAGPLGALGASEAR
ncbi:MAG: hypothetical protein RL338_655 [Chloroflexota bacterium]